MKKNQQVSDSEMEIMQIIWANEGSIMFAELLSKLDEKEKNWKPNTVLTFLARLTEKDILTSEKRGRLNEYISLISENEYMEQQTKAFLHKVYGGDAKNLVSSLLKQDYLTSKDFEELKEFWDKGGDVGE
jgi:BlaI family transcriptional regulator, penicillinase repressor